MEFAVVVVGDELLAGHTADANGPFLATRLRQLGHQAIRITIVPDRLELIVEALEDASRRAPFVCICGGLGPTHDDVTIDAVASFLGIPLDTPEEAKDQLRRIYKRGVELGYLDSAEVDEGAWRMARVPKGATVVPNDEGVAPGSVSSAQRFGEDVTVLVLPGPPRECRSVFANAVELGVVPTDAPQRTVEVHLATFEAPIAAKVTELDRDHADVKIGSYPQFGEKRVIIRITGVAEQVDAAAADVRAAFDDLVLDVQAPQ